MKRWQGSSLKNSELILQNGELSVYKGTLSTPCVIKNIAKIKNAFPALSEGFYEVFSQRLIDTEFNDDRLSDAVNHVIDTCIYPTPTIAQFISFDRIVKLNTYEEMLKKTSEYGPEIWKSYEAINLPGRIKPVWIHIDDIKKYNLKTKEDGNI